MPVSQKQIVCYYRVSTQRQGESGLGLEAQKRAVATFLVGRCDEILEEFTEIESGRKSARPKLAEALALCRRRKAILVIAKLDRLARNVHFISGLMESGVEFLAADQPTKDRFMLHIQAAFAEEEARRISERTKAALLSAKQRGVVLGATGNLLARKHQEKAKEDAQKYRVVVAKVQAEGCATVRAIRDRLNQLLVESPGGGLWHLPSTHRLLNRLKETAAYPQPAIEE